MKSRTIISYYIAISAIVLIKVVATIFQGSLVLYKNHQLSELGKQYESLEQQQVQLSQQLASSQSLQVVNDTIQGSDFQPIAPIATVRLTTAVAANNL